MTKRMIDAAEVLKVIDEHLKVSRENYEQEAVGALEVLRVDVVALVDQAGDQRVLDHLSAPLRYDVERAALDAYSEVQAERQALRAKQGGPLQQRDHRDALMAAIDAVNALRNGTEKEL